MEPEGLLPHPQVAATCAYAIPLVGKFLFPYLITGWRE
jgi:hypothetical protein